jgi:CAAX protease family protein
MTRRAHPTAAIVGLLVAFGWTFLLAGRTHSVADVRQDLVTIGAEWLVVLVLAVIAFGLEGRTLRDFLVRMVGGGDLLLMLGVLVLTYLASGLVSAFVTLPTSSLELAEAGRVPVLIRLGLVLTAAIAEEFMFRGFGIEELNRLTGSWWLAGALSWAAFTLAHVDRYGWTLGLLIPAIAGGGLTILYLWRRNLPLCMLMHAIIDGVALLLVPLLLPHAGR